MSLNARQTYYEVLEVSPDATQDEIVRAFQRAKATYSNSSPALYSVFSKEEAEELIKMINEAYTTLSNAITRRSYDQQLFDHSRRESKVERASPDDLHAIPSVGALDSSMAPQDESVFKERQVPPTLAPPKPTPRPALDPKMGRTKFSEFEKDQTIEQEISNQEFFDGSFLQKIRIYKRVSLDQICEYSRVGRHYVMAIENNDFHALPAPVFVRGFIQQLARILELDERKVADSYMKLYKQSRGSN